MTRKTLVILGLVVAMMVSLFGSAFGQTDDSSTLTPVPTSDSGGTGSRFFTHPVVQILSAYFGRDLGETTDPGIPTTTPDPNDETSTPDPNEPSPTPEATEDPQQKLAEEIAAYHEQGLGFGVLVKLYAIAEASQKACPPEPIATPPADSTTGTEQPTCTAVTVAELVDEFQSGTGMGQLFKEYGKPALLGVGHVKKALKEQKPDSESPDITTPEPKNPASPKSEDHKNNKPGKNNKGGNKGKGNH
jgi:hypothetical protein